MSDAPRVSVVIAVKNAEKFISDSIKSIRFQTFKDFEVVIVDDGSTDNTCSIVQATVREDRRFRLVFNRSVQGQPGALNYGISCSRGRLIARCDGDDMWVPERLQKQLAYIDGWNEPEPLVALGTAGYTINEAGRTLGILDVECTTVKDYRARHAAQSKFMLHHASVIFDKDVSERVGGYRSDYIGAEDTDLFTRMAEHGVVLNLPERLFYYRKHTGSFSLKKTRVQAINFLRIECNVAQRRQGLPELSYEDFESKIKTEWSMTDLRNFQRHVHVQLMYRQGSVMMVNGRPFRGGILLAMAAMTEPRRVFEGIRTVARRYL